MARIRPLVLAIATLVACRPEEDPAPFVAVAGRWEAEAVVADLTDVLELDDDGEGTVELYRQTPAALSRVTARATMSAGPSEERFDLAVRCEGESFACERFDFDAECRLDDTDTLRCEAPDWYHDDEIALDRADP